MASEDDVLLMLLHAVDNLHQMRSELHLCLKQGFFNLTKARMAGFGKNNITVLDTREELPATFSIGVEPDEVTRLTQEAKRLAGQPLCPSGAETMETADAEPGSPRPLAVFRRRETRSASGNGNGTPAATPQTLRMRGAFADAASLMAEGPGFGSGSWALEDGGDAVKITDPLQLFGGLVPPPLRKAKKNFAGVLELTIAAANMAQRVFMLERRARWHRAQRRLRATTLLPTLADRTTPPPGAARTALAAAAPAAAAPATATAAPIGPNGHAEAHANGSEAGPLLRAEGAGSAQRAGAPVGTSPTAGRGCGTGGGGQGGNR
ncbi:unnamed protein product [Phaeothamnion confervicola]